MTNRYNALILLLHFLKPFDSIGFVYFFFISFLRPKRKTNIRKEEPERKMLAHTNTAKAQWRRIGSPPSLTRILCIAWATLSFIWLCYCLDLHSCECLCVCSPVYYLNNVFPKFLPLYFCRASSHKHTINVKTDGGEKRERERGKGVGSWCSVWFDCVAQPNVQLVCYYANACASNSHGSFTSCFYSSFSIHSQNFVSLSIHFHFTSR